MFLSAEMMLQGVSVSLVAWGRFHNDWGGQMLVIFILTVAACEAAIALALVLMLFQQTRHARHRRLAAPARGQPAGLRRSRRPRRVGRAEPRLAPADARRHRAASPTWKKITAPHARLASTSTRMTMTRFATCLIADSGAAAGGGARHGGASAAAAQGAQPLAGRRWRWSARSCSA